MLVPMEVYISLAPPVGLSRGSLLGWSYVEEDAFWRQLNAMSGNSNDERHIFDTNHLNYPRLPLHHLTYDDMETAGRHD